MFDGIMGNVSSVLGTGIGGSGTLGGLLQGVGGMLFGSAEQDKTNANNYQHAMQMRDTAYSAASRDMISAGLNPAMMFSSGSAAATPGVQFQNPAESGSRVMQAVVGSATQMKVADATVNNLVQQNANLKTQAALTAADTSLRKQQTKTEEYRTPGELARSVGASYLSDVARNAAKTSTNQLSIDPTVRRLLDIAGFGGKTVSDILAPVMGTARTVGSFF